VKYLALFIYISFSSGDRLGDKTKLTSMEAIPPNGGGKTVIQLFFYVGAYTMKVALSNPVS
jgi:hypothetical protein